MFKDLIKRQQIPEEMDNPSLDAHSHYHALVGLSRINYWSRSVHILWASIQALAHKTGQKSFRILDIATGGGDIPIALWHLSHRAGLILKIEGCDKSSQAIEYARARAEQSKAPIHFYIQDVLKEKIPPGYDILMSSLFFHHLSDEEALSLFRDMGQAAKKMILINDLRRCPTGFLFAYFGTRFLSRSSIVHTDGVRSVQAAFNIEEMRELAEQAGLMGVQVERRWPSRFLLTWKK